MEHLLSALEGFGVDNARIEIEGGPEVPIVDGSALGWAIDLHQVWSGFTVAIMLCSSIEIQCSDFAAAAATTTSTHYKCLLWCLQAA